MNSKAEEADFREPDLPGDRVLALEAVLDAKGNKLPTPAVCHGYANGCGCPPCLQRSQRPLAKEFMAA
jgi:hypothetical protein